MALGLEGYNLGINVEAVGQAVPYLHFHVNVPAIRIDVVPVDGW